MVKVKMFESSESFKEPALEMPPIDKKVFYEVVNTRRSTRIFAQDPCRKMPSCDALMRHKKPRIPPICSAGSCTMLLIPARKNAWWMHV